MKMTSTWKTGKKISKTTKKQQDSQEEIKETKDIGVREYVTSTKVTMQEHLQSHKN